MKNYLQPGNTLTVPAPTGGVSSGNPVAIGSLRGFAASAAAEGEDVAIARTGVFEATKATGTAWAVGDKLFYDSVADNFTKSAQRDATNVASAAKAGNTGDGVLTLANPAFGAGVKAGVYQAVFIEPATNAGAFIVEDPDGIQVGEGNVGVAFDGVVKFTIADGATDFVAGDGFDVTVTGADNVPFGFAAAAADSGDTVGEICLGDTL